MIEPSPTGLGPQSGLRRWWAVMLLSLLFVASLTDRLILAILIEPLKHELTLSDQQIALLVGSTFAFFYSIIGIPIAWALDRGRRMLVGTVGILIWSGSTIASGLVGSFEVLLVLRIGVALGEAVLVPLGVSLISDLFPRRIRAAPLSVFISSGIFGIVCAYAVGGATVSALESGALSSVPLLGGLSTWRGAMVLVGLPSLVIGALLALTVSDPPLSPEAEREQTEGGVGAFVSKADAWRFYLFFFVGVGFISMATNSALAWYPTMLVRGFGVSLAQSGYVFSLAPLAGAAVLLALPAAMGLCERRGIQAPLLPLILVILPIGALLFSASLLQTSVNLTIPYLMAGFGLLTGGVNALTTVAVGLTAPAAFRGRLVALGLAAVTAMGLGVGPFLTAWVAETMFHGPRSLANAMLVVTVVVSPLSWLLIFLSWKPFRRAFSA